MTDSPKFSLDDLARQLAEAVPENLRELGEDLQRNFKSMLQSGLARMDVVTREEFEVQRAVLERTRAKLEALELRLAELERELASR
jgi:ubiquinone biosynthesis accessory factor UbiK